jgi:sulfur carrier protein ThiS
MKLVSSRLLEEDKMADIKVDTWLYGILGKYGGDENERIFANVKVPLQENSTISDLLAYLKMPTEERGITFINGDLSAMVGMQPDLNHVLKDNDRVAFFHLVAMWPFQYRLGISMADELTDAMLASKDMGIHHSYG